MLGAKPPPNDLILGAKYLGGSRLARISKSFNTKHILGQNIFFPIFFLVFRQNDSLDLAAHGSQDWDSDHGGFGFRPLGSGLRDYRAYP